MHRHLASPIFNSTKGRNPLAMTEDIYHDNDAQIFIFILGDDCRKQKTLHRHCGRSEATSLNEQDRHACSPLAMTEDISSDNDAQIFIFILDGDCMKQKTLHRHCERSEAISLRLIIE